MGFIDDAHSTLAEFGFNPIMFESAPDHLIKGALMSATTSIYTKGLFA
jgi:hypothetical protein